MQPSPNMIQLLVLFVLLGTSVSVSFDNITCHRICLPKRDAPRVCPPTCRLVACRIRHIGKGKKCVPKRAVSSPCPDVCRSKRKAKAQCRLSKFKGHCTVQPCKCGKKCRAKRFKCAELPATPEVCPNVCRAKRVAAIRDCHGLKPLCKVESCSRKVGTKKKSGAKCAEGAKPLPFDLTGDGVQDREDMIYVLRRIADPLGDIPPGDLTADLNGDGVVDFADATIMLNNLLDENGENSLLPLTRNYDSEHVFNFDQTPLPTVTRQVSSRAATSAFWNVVGRQAKTCGQATSGDYAKGTGPDPSITWDNGYPFNPSATATTTDYWNWARYGVLVTGAAVTLPDGARAYRRYRDASGAELTVDYDKAVREDSLIRAGVDAEIQAVRAAVRQLHDGNQASFAFHSTDSRLVNSATENWQKAVGGHRIWSVGTVTYDSSACRLNIDITIKVEDFYNFNRGQVDIATGLPDDDNGRFEVLGWARSFFSRGSITRTETIPLQCCQDSECGNPTEFDCECNLCTTQCPTTQRSGGQGFTSFTVDLKKTSGTFTATYQMFTIPDELNIFYEGATVFSTGGLVSGGRTVSITYGSPTSTSTFVTVELNAPNSGTAWNVAVTCPP